MRIKFKLKDQAYESRRGDEICRSGYATFFRCEVEQCEDEFILIASKRKVKGGFHVELTHLGWDSIAVVDGDRFTLDEDLFYNLRDKLGDEFYVAVEIK